MKAKGIAATSDLGPPLLTAPPQRKRLAAIGQGEVAEPGEGQDGAGDAFFDLAALREGAGDLGDCDGLVRRGERVHDGGGFGQLVVGGIARLVGGAGLAALLVQPRAFDVGAEAGDLIVRAQPFDLAGFFFQSALLVEGDEAFEDVRMADSERRLMLAYAGRAPWLVRIGPDDCRGGLSIGTGRFGPETADF